MGLLFKRSEVTKDSDLITAAFDDLGGFFDPSQPLPEAVGVPVHNLDAVLLGQLEVHGVALGGADLRLADLDLNNCTVYTDCTQNRFAKPLTSSSTSSTSGTMMHFSVVMSSQLTLTTSRGLSSHTFTRITVHLLYTDCTLTVHKTGFHWLTSSASGTVLVTGWISSTSSGAL